MNRFLKFLKWFGFAIILFVIFRGFLFRNMVGYSIIAKRENSAITNQKLIQEINNYIPDKNLSIKEIMGISSKITQSNLGFTFKTVSHNPNISFNSKKANCIGYAALFNSIGNYLLMKQNISNTYRFNHLVGRIDFLGFNLHSLTKNSFFQDHDFNEIINLKTGEKLYIDSSLNDYFNIGTITCK